MVRRYAEPRWGKLQAASITRADIKELMARIEAPVVANQVLASISAIFSWAIKEEILSASPCKLVDRNATRSRERVLSESELPKFWESFGDAGLIAGSALKTILLTGQRPGFAFCARSAIRKGWAAVTTHSPITTRRRLHATVAQNAAERESATPRADDQSQASLRLLSKRQVLEIVGVSFPTIWAWMRAGTFPRSRVVGGKSMWLSNEVDAWLTALPLRRLKGDET